MFLKTKNKKKGFTIVELVIVIAVIAILSAVLIPTFVSLVKKANVASDTALVKNLNTILASDTQLNGKHKTMYDALEVTKESGFDITKINAKANQNEILWDSANDVFCYLEDGKIKYVPNSNLDVKAKNVKDYEYYVIRDVKSQSDVSTKYSTYLRSSTLSTVEATKSFDVGEVTNVTTINYKNTSGTAQTVVIRTNGGTLNVNAPLDTVHHYGESAYVVIEEVASESYHVFGNVEKIEIEKGRVEIESGANVNAVVVDESNASAVKLDVQGELGALYAPETLETTGDNVPEVSTLITAENAEAEGWTLVSTQAELAEALNPTEEGVEPASKIALSANIVIENIYSESKVANIFKVNSDVELNFNTYTISAKFVVSSGVNASNALIEVQPGKTLTISGTGKIEYAQVGNNSGWNAYSSVISVQRSNVVVDGGVTIEHLGGTDMAYAIDVLTNGGTANSSLTINNGVVKSPYRAIRAFCNAPEATVYVTINGGRVVSTNHNAIWFQNPNSKANKGLLTITGGEIISNGYYNGADRYPITLGSSANITKNITGGKFVQNGVDVTSTYVA